MELSQRLEESTHFSTIVLEELIDVFHDHLSFNVGTKIRDNTNLYGIEFVFPEVIVTQNEFLSWLGFGEKWLVM